MVQYATKSYCRSENLKLNVMKAHATTNPRTDNPEMMTVADKGRKRAVRLRKGPSLGCRFPGVDQIKVFPMLLMLVYGIALSLSLSLSGCLSVFPCLSVKASASRAEGPGFESRWRRDFFGVESYQ